MKIVRVTYTTRAEYVAQNESNIRTVMADLRQLNNSGIVYNACLNADGKTFVHTAFFKSDEDQKILGTIASFKTFQEQLKASMPEAPPKQEILTLVGSVNEIFNT
jgi:hypothetical protein